MPDRPTKSAADDAAWTEFLESMRSRLRQAQAFSSGHYQDEPIIQRGSDFWRARGAQGAEAPSPAPASAASMHAGAATDAAEDPGKRRRSQLIQASAAADLTDQKTFERFFPEEARFVNASKDTDDGLPLRSRRHGTAAAASSASREERLFELPEEEPSGRTYGSAGKSRKTAEDSTAAGAFSEDLEYDGTFSRHYLDGGFGREAREYYGGALGSQYRSAYPSYSRTSWGDVPPERKKAPLTETLKELRDLERRGSRHAVFQKQIELAWDYTEPEDRGAIRWRQIWQPTYSALNNTELRAYFRWRTLWREGERTDIPGWCGLLYAYELLAMKDALALDELSSELSSLMDTYEKLGASTFTRDCVAQVFRDFEIFVEGKAELYFPEANRAFYRDVTILRQAQNAVFAAHGWEMEDESFGSDPVSAEELLQALAGISTFDPARSPFFRKYPSEAARVTSGVFERYVVHCHNRRKTSFIDGIVGIPMKDMTLPFYNVPVDVRFRGPDRRIEASAGCALSLVHGTWVAEEPASSAVKSRDLAKVFREIDREMRDAWQFGRPLKPQKVPKFAQRFIAQAIEEEKAREEAAARAAEEAERRRFKVDLTKLKSIRSAAAETREALLVDEEREGYVAQETLVPQTLEPEEPPAKAPEVPAPHKEPSAPAGTAAEGALPFGLTAEERALARALLEGKDYAAIVSASSGTLDMLVDSLNEKLFDLVGDVSFEFGDDGPCPVEDYEEELRKALLP